MFRRLGSSLATHRASLSWELGSLWEFLRDRNTGQHRADRDTDRRRSAPAACGAAPASLARDLLQVVQETVFAKKFDEKRCPLVKEESDLTDSEEGTDRRIANLIDFFFTLVKSQKEDRKSSSGSCFKVDSPEVAPRKANLELERKMEALMEFLATTGCMEEDTTQDKTKITLMEFLFGPDNKPVIETEANEKREMTLSESNINVKLPYIDETPVEEEGRNLVDMLIKYMENYDKEPLKANLTPSLSEKSKSDVTLSKMETFSDNISKTKSDSTLTHTQDTVIEREVDIKSQNSRRISETVIDLSNIKHDLEDIFAQAMAKVCELNDIELINDDGDGYDDDKNDDDTMSEAEDMQNFNSYTKPPILYNIQYMPYSVELSDIIEEDESLERSSRGMQEDRMAMVRECAEDLLEYIEDKIQRHFDDDSSGDEFDISASLKQSSISLFDLRLIPDLPPSMFIKPIVKRVDKSTSTTEISDSISDVSRRIDSANMTEDTSLSNASERQAERALDKLESLHKFFSRSRLDIIKESQEEDKNEKKNKPRSFLVSETRSSDFKPGQASLDDVEELQDEVLEMNYFESDEVIIEENEKDNSNEDAIENNLMNIEDGEVQDEEFSNIYSEKRNSDMMISENDIKMGIVSEIVVDEEVTEDLIVDDMISPNDGNDFATNDIIEADIDNACNIDVNDHFTAENRDVLDVIKDLICKAETVSENLGLVNDKIESKNDNDKLFYSKSDDNIACKNETFISIPNIDKISKSFKNIIKSPNDDKIEAKENVASGNEDDKIDLAKNYERIESENDDDKFDSTKNTSDEMRKMNEDAKVSQNIDRIELNSEEFDDKVITDTDFTEIDTIITKAVKIILVNELEFHNSELKLKQEIADPNH